MKVGIVGREVFPVYILSIAGSNKAHAEVEVDKAVLKKWKEAFDLFHTTQKEIIAALDKSNNKDHIWYNQKVFYGFDV